MHVMHVDDLITGVNDVMKNLELCVFEQNRVGSILRNCKSLCYIATKQNPNNVATRECHVD